METNEWKLLELDNTERDILQTDKYEFKYESEEYNRSYFVANIRVALTRMSEGRVVYYRKKTYHETYTEAKLLDMLIRALESHQMLSGYEYIHYQKNGIDNAYHIENILTHLTYQKENLNG